MKQLTTTAIILTRTDFGEADRILTMLTPDYGKLRLHARGVRKIKSKLAGGIDLFSVSQISFMQGRRELGTLISARLQRHYGQIVKDLNRTMAAYDLIKLLNRATEDQPEAQYYSLLEDSFAALDQASVPLALIQLWFRLQLLKLAGNTPNLYTDDEGSELAPQSHYELNVEQMAFKPTLRGSYTANDIKFLRLAVGDTKPKALTQIKGYEDLVNKLVPLVEAMYKRLIRT